MKLVDKLSTLSDVLVANKSLMTGDKRELLSQITSIAIDAASLTASLVASPAASLIFNGIAVATSDQMISSDPILL